MSAVSQAWFWVFLVECVKAAFQCVHVLFWVCLRWEHLREGVVVLGVTGILPSLLPDSFACGLTLLESNWPCGSSIILKNSGSSNPVQFCCTQGSVTWELGHIPLPYFSETVRIYTWCGLKYCIPAVWLKIPHPFSQLTKFKLTFHTSFQIYYCKASNFVAWTFLFIFAFQKDEQLKLKSILPLCSTLFYHMEASETWFLFTLLLFL